MKLPCVYDRALRNKKVINELFKYLKEDIEAGIIPEDIRVICSGKFGKLVEELSPYDVLKVDGGLRWKDSPKLVLEENPGKCVFIDDGIYTCRTYEQIRSAVEQAGGELLGTYFGYKAGNPFREIHMKVICTSEDVRRVFDEN